MSTKANIVIELAREHGIQLGKTDLPNLLEAVGDELRSGRLRTMLGASALPAVCIESLSDPEAASSALRVLANLCIDNDHESAKKALCDAEIIPKLTELSACPELYSLGAPAKLRDTSQQLHGTLQQGATAACWGLCLVEDLLTKASGRVHWTRQAVQALADQEQSFRTATKESNPAIATLNTTEIVSLELQILESIGSILERSTDSFWYALVHPSDGPLRTLLELMTVVPEVPIYWQHALLDGELEQEVDAALAKLRTGAAHAIIGAAGVDANLEQLCPFHHNQVESSWFVEELQKVLISNDPPSTTCAMMALGNLARDDKRSEAIIEIPFLLPKAVELLDRQDTKLSYAVLGLLVNLAVPLANRVKIFNAGVLTHLAPMLEREHDMVQPLQFAVVKLLRQLVNTSHSPQILIGVVATPSCDTPLLLSSVAELLNRTDNVSLRTEIARLYTAILRSLGRLKSSDCSLSRVSAQASMSEDEAKSALNKAWAHMKQELVVDALVELLCHSRQHAVTMSEGLLGLAILSSKSSDEGKFKRYAEAAIMTINGMQKSHPVIREEETEKPFHTGLNALEFVLCNMPPQVIGNACSLIQLWINASPVKSRTVLSQALLQPLKDCEDRMPADVRPTVSRAKTLLMND